MLEEIMKEDLTLFNKFFDIIEKGAKCFCGEKLLKQNMEWYPHKGGIYMPLEMEKEKQWVYIVCGNCGYQMSWKKLLGRYM